MPSLSKWHIGWIILLSLACILLSSTAFRHRAAPPGRVVVTSSPPSGSSASPGVAAQAGGSIYVHVSGQVAKPGLYRLPGGSRVMDAISYAGGARDDADMEALNLATPLRDGQKLTVPVMGERPPDDQGGFLTDSPSPTPPPPVLVRPDPAPPSIPVRTQTAGALTANEVDVPETTPRESSTAKLRHAGDGVVDINTASAVELQRLPGVGPSTAQKIVQYRDEHGGYSTIEELMEVKGIGPAKLRKMQPFIVLRPPQ